MLPLMPFSTLTRTVPFVTQEWNTYFSNGRVDQVAGGWRGILYANLAIIQPKTSWNFFANTNFDYTLLDGGASLTWYRAYSAALGGSPAATSGKRAEQAPPVPYHSKPRSEEGKSPEGKHVVSGLLKRLTEAVERTGM